MHFMERNENTCKANKKCYMLHLWQVPCISELRFCYELCYKCDAEANLYRHRGPCIKTGAFFCPSMSCPALVFVHGVHCGMGASLGISYGISARCVCILLLLLLSMNIDTWDKVFYARLTGICAPATAVRKRKGDSA